MNEKLAATRRVSGVERVPLEPIRTEEELDAATRVIHTLIDLEELSGPEEEYLAKLTDLVEDYEAAHYPDEPVSDAEILQRLLEIKNGAQG